MMSSEDLGQQVKVLLEEISDLKGQVCNLVVQGHEDFLKSSVSLLSLADSSSTLSASADSLRQATAEKLPQLVRTTKEQKLMGAQLEQLGLVQDTLESIIQLHKLLHSLEERLNQQDVWKAVEITAEVRRLLPQLKVRKEDVRVFEALRMTFLELKDSVRAALDDEWSRAVVWTDTCSLQLGLPAAKMQRLLSALAMLDEVRSRVSRLVQLIVDRFLLPAIKGHVSLNAEASAGGLRLLAERLPSPTPPQPLALLTSLASVLSLLHRALLGLSVGETAATVADLTRYALDPLSTAIIEHSLQHALPTSQADVGRFGEEVAPQCRRFEEKMQEWSILAPDNRNLSQYVSEMDKLLVERKREAILIQCREMMKKSLFDVSPVGDEACDGDPRTEVSVTFFPRCLVSRSLVEMLAVVDQAIDDLLACTNEASDQYKAEVLAAVQNVMEFYPRIVTTVHKEALESVPQAAAIFHCNCMYLAHHCLFDFRLSRLMPRASFVHLVQPLRSAANDQLLAQMRRQRETAEETLLTACADLDQAAEKAARLSNALRLTCRQLGVLSRVWRVLPKHVFGQVMGAVFNHVCQRLVNDLCAIEDISTDDCDTLLELFRFVREQALGLFRVPEEGEEVCQKFSFAEDDAALSGLLGKFVPAWPKLNEAMFVLDAGLLAISERWAGGKGPLAEAFSVSEMKGLVKALFQNTEKRAAVLAKMR